MSMRQTTRWMAVAVLAVAGLTAWGQAPAAAESTGTPQLQYSPAVFDFGQVWQGEKAECEFTVKNVGTAPLTLNVHTTCGCTTASKPTSPLAPGEESKFKVTFDTSRPTTANKKVIIDTNEPARPKVEIDVKGHVKALFEAKTSQPGLTNERIVFLGLEPETIASEKMELVNRYPKPVHLKLKEGQNFAPFDVQFKEIEPGQKYEITAVTVPPLRIGMNQAIVRFSTDLDIVPELQYRINGNAQPSAFVAPFRVIVRPEDTVPTEHVIQVHYRRTKPINVTDVKSSLGTLKWELLPEKALAPTAPTGLREVRVTVPKFEDIPEGGATIQIITNHQIPKYQTLEVKVMRGTPAASQPAQPVRTRRDTPVDRRELPPEANPRARHK